MATYIISLDSEGRMFYESVIRYCEITHQPMREDVYQAIYRNVISEILHHVTDDYKHFLSNIMSIPTWALINFTDTDTPYETKKHFSDDCRAFALYLYRKICECRIISYNPFISVSTYSLQHVTLTTLVFNVYVEASHI